MTPAGRWSVTGVMRYGQLGGYTPIEQDGPVHSTVTVRCTEPSAMLTTLPGAGRHAATWATERHAGL